MVPQKNQNVLQVLSWPNINKVHAFSWPLVSMNKSEFKYKSWAVPLTWKCMLFHGHWAASVSSQYHHPGWQVDLSQQAGGFILLSTQLHFNLNARLEEGPLSPDLWNGDICGRAGRVSLSALWFPLQQWAWPGGPGPISWPTPRLPDLKGWAKDDFKAESLLSRKLSHQQDDKSFGGSWCWRRMNDSNYQICSIITIVLEIMRWCKKCLISNKSF